jgi:hypothetical protein
MRKYGAFCALGLHSWEQLPPAGLIGYPAGGCGGALSVNRCQFCGQTSVEDRPLTDVLPPVQVSARLEPTP